jgi:hypothetical protein
MSPGAARDAPPPARPRWPEALAPAALAAVLCLWGAWFIYRTSVVIEGTRYFSLFDDAMISMAYARNAVEGFGLNWARFGEPVEGFSTPLWTFLMIPVNALPLPLALRPLVVQAMALGLLVATVLAVRRLVLRHFTEGEERWWLPAAVLTAFYYPLGYWSLMGMETALQALLVVLAAQLAFDVLDGDGRRIPALGAVGAAAYLVRMDMLVAVAAVVGFLAVSGGIRRRDRRRWLIAAALVIAAIAGYQVFRVAYFGDVLPNTYYLKLTGVPLDMRLLRGVATYTDFVRANLWALLLMGLAIAPLVRTHPKTRLPVALFVAFSAYSVWIGGDAWEMKDNVRANRFLVLSMPVVFAAFNAALNRYVALWRTRTRDDGGLRPLARFYGTAVPTVAVFLLINGLVLSDRAEENWGNQTVAASPYLVTSHALVLGNVLKLQRVALPEAKVATLWAGIPAYFSDFRMIDIYGYSDRHTARLDSVVTFRPRNLELYVPGHTKWDNGYVFRRLKPHAFLQAWQLGDRTEEVMARQGFVRREGFWVKEGSPWIRPESGEPSG